MKSESHSPLNFKYSSVRIWLKHFFVFIGIGMVGFSLYNNIFTNTNQEKKTLWVIDTSLSMVVQDIEGTGDIRLSRMELAKSLILSGRTLSSGKHALMTFGVNATLLLPFASESEVFLSTTRGLEPTLYNSRTDIEGALAAIDLIYGNTPLRVILFTDGEESESGITQRTSPENNRREIVFVGIGTTGGGPMLQGYDANGNPRYKQFEGKEAISHLDKTHLEALAKLYHADSIMIDSIQKGDSVLEKISATTDVSPRVDTNLVMLCGIVFLLLGLIFPSIRYT